MIFAIHNKRIQIKENVFKKINQYKQLNLKDKEAGGILVGRILLEDGNYIIDDVSEPYASDYRKRSRFNRKVEGHQEYFEEKWLENDGRCFYLGEWHTHPEKIPHPSSVDLSEWKRLLLIDFETDRLFFLILGTEKFRIWSGKCGSWEIEELVLEEYDD